MFADPEAVARYLDGPPRFMPGYHDVQLMAGVLLGEHVPPFGDVLALGAGGGLEMKAIAATYKSWRFTGVDPSAQMLALARQTLHSTDNQVNYIEGLIDDAPLGPFDGATCLLTLHFLDAAERLSTLEKVRQRLRPGAPLVVAHSSFPTAEPQRSTWIARYAAFAKAAGAPDEMIQIAVEKVSGSLEVLTPTQDEQLMVAAGFERVEQFYQGFTWRGWVGYAPS